MNREIGLPSALSIAFRIVALSMAVGVEVEDCPVSVGAISHGPRVNVFM